MWLQSSVWLLCVAVSCSDIINITDTLNIPYFDVPAPDLDGRVNGFLNQNFHPSAATNLLVYAYTRQLNINDKNARNLLEASSFLNIKPVVNACVDFLRRRINAYNVVDITNSAKSARNLDLILAAESFILNHFAEVTKSWAFLRMQSDDFLKILRSNEIRNVSEKIVFEASYRWLQHSPAHRAGLLYKVMEHVRFPLLDLHYLTQKVKPKFINNDNAQINHLIDDAIKRKSFPNSGRDNQGCRSWPRVGTNKWMAFHWYTSPHVMQLYDPVTDQLQSVANPPSRNDYCIVVENCIVYAIGGGNTNAVNTYNPRSDSWKTIAPMIAKRQYAAATVVSGVIYVCGGIYSRSLSTLESYNTLNNKWTPLASMSQTRDRHRLVAIDNFLYAIGGIEGKNILKSVEKYDIAKKTWTYVEPMLNARYNFGAALLNRKIYVCGGYSGNDYTNLAEVFDPVQHTWTPISKMITQKSYFSLVPYQEKLWALKGSALSTEVYDPTTNSWTSKPIKLDKVLKDTFWESVIVNF